MKRNLPSSSRSSSATNNSNYSDYYDNFNNSTVSNRSIKIAFSRNGCIEPELPQIESNNLQRNQDAVLKAFLINMIASNESYGKSTSLSVLISSALDKVKQASPDDVNKAIDSLVKSNVIFISKDMCFCCMNIPNDQENIFQSQIPMNNTDNSLALGDLRNTHLAANQKTPSKKEISQQNEEPKIPMNNTDDALKNSDFAAYPIKEQKQTNYWTKEAQSWIKFVVIGLIMLIFLFWNIWITSRVVNPHHLPNDTVTKEPTETSKVSVDI